MRRPQMCACLLIVLVQLGVLRGSEKRLVLMDTDFGNYVDDAVALAMLLSSEKVDLKAITTSGGDCEDRAWMVCRLLTMVDRKEIPVAWGRDPQPTGEVREMYQYRYHPAVLFNRTAKPVKDDAADLLYATLKELPKKKATLLVIGPLTNVARLFEKYSDSKELLGRIVVLGGRLQEQGEPEWNLRQDVKSAQKVFASGVPIVVVPADVTELKLDEKLQDELLGAQTMLTQQLQALLELSPEQTPELFDAVAVAVMLDEAISTSVKRKLSVNDRGHLQSENGENGLVVTKVAEEEVIRRIKNVATLGRRVEPRPLKNFSQLVERTGLPRRVHAFEDYETDIERRWWLTGVPITDDVPQGNRAIKSTLTLDFDDRQGDLQTMYSAVVFNPVPGPPMGEATRLSFRYKLDGTDQLRVQLYSLSNGYHRYLALKDLPQGKWQEATVDMTKMRRPIDAGEPPLSEDERIDDIQFYVAPTARVSIDDVVLYDATPPGEKQPFPARIVFTGLFDTGKQGQEWPGDFTIVDHKKPLKWKAAKSVPDKSSDGKQNWLRISFRGQRPIGQRTTVRFKFRPSSRETFTIELANSKTGKFVAQDVVVEEAKKWLETSITFDVADESFSSADELRFRLAADAELLVDDVLVYEPGK